MTQDSEVDVAVDGLIERRATLERLKTLVGGRVWQGSIDDDTQIPRDTAGKVLPHIVVGFGAPVRTTRDRKLAVGEKGQPHVLPANIACIAGDYDAAQETMSAALNLLLDWAPSETADAYEAKGGYGTRRPSTESSPTRFVEGLFLESTINNT